MGPCQCQYIYANPTSNLLTRMDNDSIETTTNVKVSH